MTAQITYLECIDPSCNSHKFYEVSVDHCTLTIRYGRIGTQGRQQIKTLTTMEAAAIAATRKIREQERKGYRIVSPAPEPPAPSPAPTTPAIFAEQPCLAPIRWRFNSGATNFGIAVDAEHCWLGNEKGQVLKLDHQGNVLQQLQLPNAVKCIVTDDIWVYAGCDNGNVYDLTGKMPYLAYEIERGLDIFWLTIQDGMLAIADGNGGVTKTDPEGEILWTRLSSGKLGWMLCGDDQAFYHGHTKGVTAYGFASGQQLWHQSTVGKVLFGCLAGDRLYVATSGKQVQCFSTKGELLGQYPCTASVYACAVDEQRHYLFAADSSAHIYCFTQAGQLLWRVRTGCGSALSMHHWREDLYIATNQGVLACLDVTAAAVQAAQGGQLPETTTIEAGTPTQILAATTLEMTTVANTAEPAQGVILECFRQGQKLRVRAISAGFHRDWMVQFPRNLRHEGDRYWVQTLKASQQGHFYRPHGEIKRLQREE